MPHGIRTQLSLHGRIIEVELGLIGDFQLHNILAAVALAEACGEDALTISHLLHKMQPVHGRMEKVATLDNGATAYVDYAHTAAALSNALRVMRRHCQGKLSVVFGCGGDRDKTKRPMMGKAACAAADRVYVTDDNPRTESASNIRTAILRGCDDKAIEVPEREKAIAAALNELEAGDILLVAGKGHEDYQIIGKEKHHFDDAEIIRTFAA